MPAPVCPICKDPAKIRFLHFTIWGHECSAARRFIWWDREMFTSQLYKLRNNPKNSERRSGGKPHERR